MSYCKAEKKARVVYSFNGVEKIYETDKTPIDVSIKSKRIRATENYQEQGYTITFYSPNNRGMLTQTLRDYVIFPVDPAVAAYFGGGDYAGISYWLCDDKDFTRDSVGNYNGPGISPSTLQIISNGRKCPAPLKNRCSIQIKYQNTVIFQDQGECPINFRVECGDCPEGYVRVEIPKYPGYKCIEKCPPETSCECDCGDVICCYGSNGQVLKTIPKEL